MKTLAILAIIASMSYSVDALITPPVLTKARGNTCASVCNCTYGPCDYGSQESSAASCTVNGRSSDCCNYCTN